MKKYIITLALALGFGMNVNAQIGQYNNTQSDGFFANNSYSGYRESPFGDIMPLLPTLHGLEYDVNAEPDTTPIGSGLLLLGGMALAYGMRKKKEE